MIKRRKRRQNNISTIWTWVSFIVFFIVLLILGASIYKKQTPAKLISSFFKSDQKESGYAGLSKKGLVQLAHNQEFQIDSIRQLLDSCLGDDGFEKGIISTTSDALNMRSSPSISSGVLMKIPNGSTVRIIYFDSAVLVLEGSQGSWCKIKYANQEGWVWGNYIERINE